VCCTVFALTCFVMCECVCVWVFWKMCIVFIMFRVVCADFVLVRLCLFILICLSVLL
jgi:hypothetical protein